MNTLTKERVKLDTTLRVEQKQLFEKAALLEGYSNLSDFIIVTVQKKATEIIKTSEKIIASEKDKEIFFNALEHPPAPNERMLAAKKEYEKLLSQ